MKILVVEPHATRRAELVDWTCELPGFVLVDAVPGRAEADALLATTHVDIVVLGTLPRWPVSGTALVEARGSMNELAAALSAHRANRRASEYLQRLDAEHEARNATLQTLQYRLRSEPRLEVAETIDLREWLPRTIARLRAVVPPFVELVPLVAVDTLPVRCVATLLEQVVYEIVLRACGHLPWGGTVWLTAAPGAEGEVTLDVLENGRGEIRDVTLRASVPVRS